MPEWRFVPCRAYEDLELSAFPARFCWCRRDITERLRPSQLEAMLAHEFCHVRRHDNLTSALHMIVEAIFWFHPLVWWIGSRLVEERERACDEAVLISGATPHDYVQGILEVCKSYLETPLACVSGVTGSNLKKRIHLILARRLPKNLSFAKKLTLAGSGAAALLIPVALGIVGTPLIEAQSQPAAPGIALQSLELKPGRRPPVPGFPNRPRTEITPGYIKVENASLRDLIQRAYRLRNFQIVSGPAWIDSHDYEVIAKASGKPSIKSWMRALGPILQTLLQDRFQLEWHYATRKTPVYLLTIARGGSKLDPAKEKNCKSFRYIGYIHYPSRKRPNECGMVAAVNMRLNMQANAYGMKVAPDLVNFLSGRVRRPVIDETGLTGRYDFEFEWNAAATRKALSEPGLAGSPDSPTIFTALKHQLGLKLEPSKRPTKVLVVDHAERPELTQLSAR